MTRSYVLFVCVHNAGRSQVAKALFDRAAIARGLEVRAESGGTEPGDARNRHRPVGRKAATDDQ